MKRYSPLLTSTSARLIVLALTFGSLLNTLRTLGPDGPAVPLVSIAVIFAAIGTVGWTLCQRIGAIRWFYGYFAVMSGLLIAYSSIEVQATHAITTNASWAIPILFQGVVLEKNHRRVLIAALFGGQLVVALMFVALPNVIPAAVYFGVILVVVVYFRDLIEREAEARAVLDEANRKLTEYAHQAEELAAAKERNRLAREIHDNLGHYLTAANMQIEAAIAVMNRDSALAVRSLERAQSLTREGLSEIRRSIAALRASPTESRPLHEAILTLVKEHQAAGLNVTYQVDGVIRPCSAQLEMALYRIAQEGLTNIRKHSSADHAALKLNYLNSQVIGLQLQDDGIGSDQVGGCFGLLGIRERVELLGGKLTIRTAPGQGFALEVELPT